MGLLMYSPSISKRQLPSKQQPTSPPYTPPQVEDNLEEVYQNSRTSTFGNGRVFVHRNIISPLNSNSDIPEPPEPLQRSQRSRRSSLPYNLVQQHIQRLHQLHQLHRTREQQQMSSNLASRRGLNSTHHLSLNHRNQLQHMQHAIAQARRDRTLSNESSLETSRNIRDDRLEDSQYEIIDFSFDDFVSSLDNNSNNNNNNNNNNNSSSNSRNGLVDVGIQRNDNISSNVSNNNNNNNHHHHHHHHQIHNDNDNSGSNNSSHPHRPSNVALDNVIRRVNLLRQISQQQEIRSMRSSSRHHRSSTGHSSSGRSSRTTTSQNNNIIDRRNDLIHRGIDVLPSTNTRHSAPDSSPLFHDHNSPLPSLQRLSAWHTRRGYNLISDLHPHQRTERRSSFADDFYLTSEMSHPYDSDDSHFSHILSPIPRRYDSRFAATTLNSLPVGPGEHELLDSNDNNNSSRTEQRGSASGEVC